MQPLRKAWIGMIVWLLISGMWLHCAPAPTQAAPVSQFDTLDNRVHPSSSNTQSTDVAANPLITGTWQSGFNDFSFSNGTITSVITDAAGNWYFGGYFNQIGGIAANNIARWDGTSWSALATTQPNWANWNYQTPTMAFWGDDLYVGGANMRIGGLDYVDLAYWDGAAWHQAGSGFDQYGTVSHIAVFNNELFVYGDFLEFNGVDVTWFARWDGTNTRQVYGGLYSMQFMQASSNNIYIGGKQFVNETLVDVVKAWDGTTFQPISSADINPRSLKVINDQLYGVRKLSATTSALMRWDGSAWVVVIDAIPFVLHNFAFDNDQFYAEAQNGTSFDLYRYTDQSWQPITDCSCNTEHTLYLADDQLFMSSKQHKPLITYVNNQWQEISVKSADPYPNKIVTYLDDVYVASTQTRIINNMYQKVKYMRSWENNTWKTIYQIPNNTALIDMKATENGVYFLLREQSLGFYDTYYYQQGQSNVITLPRIGLGISEMYELFVVNGNQLYAVVPGSFYRWNGTNWINDIGLPNGTTWGTPFIYKQQVYVLSYSGSNINGLPIWRIFRRNGNEWIDQNISFEGIRNDNAANVNGLYVAGQFYHNNQVYQLVQWDGTQLRFFDTPDAAIDTVAAEGNNLYIGGMFDQLPGCVCYNLGYWNGSVWQPVGGGTNGRVWDLALSGNRLYLTGWFSQTGNVAAVEFGLWLRNDVDIPRSYLPVVSR